MIRIHAPLSRQPLVKGERLVRSEVSAAMLLCKASTRPIRAENYTVFRRTSELFYLSCLLCAWRFLIVGNRADAGYLSQKFCCGPTPKEPPTALQTSECNELLNPTRTSCMILAQRQPGKLHTGSMENGSLIAVYKNN